MKKTISVIFIFACCALNASADCTLKRPGPFLKSDKDPQLRKTVTEDSSEEIWRVSPSSYLKVGTYGCEDSWGWKIRFESSRDNDIPKNLQEALALLESKLDLFDKRKLQEYEIEKKLGQLKSHFKSAKRSQTKTGENAIFCDRKSNLNPKECVSPLKVEIGKQNGKSFCEFSFDDLEN